MPLAAADVVAHCDVATILNGGLGHEVASVVEVAAVFERVGSARAVDVVPNLARVDHRRVDADGTEVELAPHDSDVRCWRGALWNKVDRITSLPAVPPVEVGEEAILHVDVVKFLARALPLEQERQSNLRSGACRSEMDRLERNVFDRCVLDFDSLRSGAVDQRLRVRERPIRAENEEVGRGEARFGPRKSRKAELLAALQENLRPGSARHLRVSVGNGRKRRSLRRARVAVGARR